MLIAALALGAGFAVPLRCRAEPTPRVHPNHTVINTLRSDLEQSAASERRWANTWGTIWVVAVAGQGAIIPFSRDKDLQIDLGFGAASAALGFIPTWIMPPRALGLWRDLQEQGKDRDEARLRAALEEDRMDKAYRRGVIAHVGNVGANLALGAIQAFAIGHKQAALITVLAGIPVGIVMIESQPRQKRNGVELTLAPAPGGAIASARISF